ncbi:MAG: hypothetical protein ABEJ64_03075 [Candidatus Nanohaloarchaea archaeon]
MDTDLPIGDCILCGSRVLFSGDFYETGEGYCHQHCMTDKHVAR